ncbi:MAG: acyl-CoA dehydrogenase family protein [Pseudomonadota bacterium]
MAYQTTPDPFGSRPSNQTPAFYPRNLFTGDPLLVALSDGISSAFREDMEKLGAEMGSAEVAQLGDLANRNIPVLKTHDERGARVDRVDFHPSYHALMRRSIARGLQGSVWESDASSPLDKGHRHQARALRFYMTAATECGHLCPLTMTNAAPAALRHNSALAREWLPRLINRHYDPSAKAGSRKAGATVGMGMTEKQGGTDVRANVTLAEPASENFFLVNGHKWFMSAPMSDAFVILAQTRNGLSCLFIPRILDDGAQNGLRFQRLKDKLGNRSNASAEVEFHNAVGFLIGAEGHGVRTILDMVTLTRLDCSIASAGMMRAAISHAVHHARHRTAFGSKLIEKPLHLRVLADMALDAAAAAVLSFRLAESFDEAGKNQGHAAFARLMTPVVKYWVCKATPPLVTEAMECMGGNGYIEDWPMPRLYREAPVNAIWEGSGNVMCLDVLRALRANPESLDAVIANVEDAFGGKSPALTDVLRKAANAALKDEGSARILTEQLALTVAAAELRRIARSDIADAFLEGRLNRPFSTTYGMMDSRFDPAAMVDAMYPATQ